MPSKTLSILIPARSEMFLRRTVENLLQNIKGDTEILVGLDGEWADPPIPDDPRVTIVYYGKSIGQRAMTNQLARLSKATYVMKLDAHCVMDEGFDVKMMDDMQPDWTMIPTLYNLHGFDWKCKKCGSQWYQSPTPTHCQKRIKDDVFVINPACDGKEFEKVILFKPRFHRRSYTYRFDKTLHFQYWGSLANRKDNQGDLIESMSAQGSCFMLTRKKYWELDICDEQHGSWGQQGTEVACKTWLSGGRLMVTKKTWYSHLFRTQGGDFGFPYPQSGKQMEHAREYSRHLFMDGKWKKAIHPLSWLLDKFAPVPEWHDGKETKPVKAKKPSKGIVYYTDNELDKKIAFKVREQIKKGMKQKHIVSASLQPILFGTNLVIPEKRGYITMTKQILAGLKAQKADVIFFCEHDVLYHPSHFDYIPTDRTKVSYNVNLWKVRDTDGHALRVDDCRQLSGLVAYRDILIQHYQIRLDRLEAAVEMWGENSMEFRRYIRQIGFEPGTHNRAERLDDLKSIGYRSAFPNIDIRNGANLTGTKWKKDQFRNQKYTEGWTEGNLLSVEGWGIKENDFQKLLDMI